MVPHCREDSYVGVLGERWGARVKDQMGGLDAMPPLARRLEVAEIDGDHHDAAPGHVRK